MTSAITELLDSTSAPESPGADLALPDGVVLAVVDDGSSRLLNLDGRFFGIQPGGTELLLDTLRHGSAAAATRTAERYGVPEQRVRADLSAFLAGLTRQGLLVPATGRKVRPRRAGGVLTFALRLARRCLRPFGSRAWGTLTLAALCVRMFGWARTAALWERLAPLGPPPADDEASAGVVERIDRAVRDAAAAHPAVAECKERALACWALLREAGVPSRLVVGIDLYPFLGHCWCEWDGRAVSDDGDRCYRFVPVWTRE